MAGGRSTWLVLAVLAGFLGSLLHTRLSEALWRATQREAPESDATTGGAAVVADTQEKTKPPPASRRPEPEPEPEPPKIDAVSPPQWSLPAAAKKRSGEEAEEAARGRQRVVLGGSSPGPRRRNRSKARRKKNVLFVVSDDLRATSLYDSRLTPNIRRFAKTAVDFRRAYAQAPMCNPSRTSFLTGHMPDVTKVYGFEATSEETLGNRGQTSFFSQLRASGFESYGFGKIWHWEPYGPAFSKYSPACFADENDAGGGEDLPTTSSFEERDERCRRFRYWPSLTQQEWGCDHKERSGRCAPKQCAETRRCDYRDHFVLPDDDPGLRLFDERVADAAVELLAEVPLSGTMPPYILGVGFHHPHLKWIVPQQFWNNSATRPIARRQSDAAISLAPKYAFGDLALSNRQTLQLVDGTQIRNFFAREPPMPFLAERAQRELRAAYEGSVRVVDEQFGRVLEAFDAINDDDAVVIFTADHGYGLGEKGHWGKSNLYEVDARVPLYVRLQRNGQRSPSISRQPVELVDLFKTIVDAAGVPYEAGFYGQHDGVSLKRHVKALAAGSSTDATRLQELPIGKKIAVTILPKCPSEFSVPRNCPRRSWEWPADAVVGYAARSRDYRYVAWMAYNKTLDSVDWSREPVAEEFYDHRWSSEFDPDDWDLLNLLHAYAFRSKDSHVRRELARASLLPRQVRDLANNHLTELRARARARQTNAHGKYPFRFFDTHFGADARFQAGLYRPDDRLPALDPRLADVTAG